MSFNMEEKMISIPLLDTWSEHTRKTVYDRFLGLENSLDRVKRGSGRLKIPIYFRLPPDPSSGNIRINIQYIYSSGRQIGFYNSLVDLDSGYVLLSTTKSKEFIPFCKFTDFINTVMFKSLDKGSKPVSVEWPVVKYYLERLKLYDLDLYGFFEGIYNETYSQRGSGSDTITKHILTRTTEDIEEFTVEDYQDCLRYLQEVHSVIRQIFGIGESFSLILNGQLIRDIYNHWAYAIGESNIDDEPDILGDFIQSLGSRMRQSDSFPDMYEGVLTIHPRDRRKRVEKRGDSRDKSTNDKFLFMSSDINLRSLSKITVRGKIPSRSELIALNFIDMLDVAGEEEYEEFYQMVEEGDLDDLKELTERLDIDDIVKGAKLTAIKRGVDSARSLTRNDAIWKYIERRSDVNNRYALTSGIPDYLSPEEETDYMGNTGHGKMGVFIESYIYMSRYIERITKKLDNM